MTELIMSSSMCMCKGLILDKGKKSSKNKSNKDKSKSTQKDTK